MPDYPKSPTPPSAARVVPPETPRFKGLGALPVLVVVVAGLYFGRAVLIPITLAIILSFLIAPLVNLLRRIRLGNVLSVVLSVLISLAVIITIGAVLGAQVADLAVGLPRYQATVEKKIDRFQERTFGKLTGLVSDAGRLMSRNNHETILPERRPPPINAEPTRGEPAPAPIPVEVREPTPTPLQLIARYLAPIVAPLETTGIVIVVAIFILLQREDLRDRLIRLLGSNDLHRTTTAMDEAARRLSRYFLVQLGINASVGLIITGGLYVIGAPSPILWGALAALLRFVPYVGTWIAAAMAVALAAAVDPGWSMALWTLALFIVTDLLTGQIIEPMMYGHSTGLSPFSVVVAAIFWSWIWGPIGLIMSTPLTLCLLVLGRHVDRLEFLDVLLGDRPALTPVENFYQRALAGDPDEALAQAEVLLQDMPLSSYYDEVPVKGLQLAANDVLRGVVTALQLERIKAAVSDLIDGLEGVEDRDPAPELAQPGSTTIAEQHLPRSHAPVGTLPPPASEAVESPPRRVLCITGRGPLDEPASGLLEQLLRKHGFSPRVVPHQAASRARFAELDLAGIDTVCLFQLDIRGAPSQLRYLVQRIRQRHPEAAIVVGLWDPQEAGHDTETLRSTIPADVFAGSLREMIDGCLASATRPGAISREDAHMAA